MPTNRSIPILVILGPTASGKSDLAVDIARSIANYRIGGYSGAEIVSADSRQVYRGLDIGSGKITKKEMKGVPHHLLDVADSRKQFSAERFQKLAHESIRNIAARGKLPIICGGTGFYIDAVVNGTVFPAVTVDKELRAKLADKSAEQLIIMLSKLDPARARVMAANNSARHNCRRLIRAIEVARRLGADQPTIQVQKKEDWQTDQTNEWPAETSHTSDRLLPHLRDKYNPIFIGIKPGPNELRRRIHDRLIKRLHRGMLAEARRLHRPIRDGGSGLSWKRMEELGLEYRYMALFLQGKIERDAMIEKLETEIWRYSKRQMTWFKRDSRIRWFSPDQRGLPWLISGLTVKLVQKKIAAP